MLFSEIFIVIGASMVVLALAVLFGTVLMDLFIEDTTTSQPNHNYSYDINEHQNYWDADK